MWLPDRMIKTLTVLKLHRFFVQIVPLTVLIQLI